MKRRLLVLVAAGLVLAAVPAAAQVTSIGPRVGVSVDPDQFTFGGQLNLGPYDPSFYFSPNLEVGIGDDLTIVQFNFDVDYHFPIRGERWNPYVGIGPAVAVIDFDNDRFGRADSDTELGINFIGGFQFKNRTSSSAFFTELRIGVGDIPELKALVGWNFGI